MANPSKISLTGALPGSAVPLPFFLASDNTTPATDMSANMRTPWIGESADRVSLWLAWPGAGTGVTAPTGTWSIEETNDSASATGIVVPVANLPGFSTGQPAGTSGRMLINPYQSKTVLYAVVYTASSGGTGAVATIIMGV